MIIIAFAVSSKIMLNYSLIQKYLLSHCDHVYSRLQRCIHEDSINKKDFLFFNNVCH